MAEGIKYRKGFYVVGILTIIVLVAVYLLRGCPQNSAGPLKLSDLVFETDDNKDCVVYIEENGMEVPYLALQSDSDGMVLLLRSFLLDMPMRISAYSSYYRDSEINQWLNTEFLDSIQEEIRNQIPEKQITVTKESAILSGREETEQIAVKAFLLSAAQIGYPDISIACPEDSVLPYFEDEKNRTAAYMDGRNGSWWMRTPNLSSVSSSFGLGADGKLGSGNSSDTNGIRPAFYLDGDMNVSKTEKDGDIEYHILAE